MLSCKSKTTWLDVRPWVSPVWPYPRFAVLFFFFVNPDKYRSTNTLFYARSALETAEALVFLGVPESLRMVDCLSILNLKFGPGLGRKFHRVVRRGGGRCRSSS